PGRLPEGASISVPVQHIDFLPTLLELEGMPRPPKVAGRSLLPLIRGESKEELPIVAEGRGTRSIEVGGWRLVERDSVAEHVRTASHGDVKRRHELYDLAVDPGEREDVHDRDPTRVAELGKQLADIMKQSRERAGGGSRDKSAASGPAHLFLRFAGKGAAHRITGTLHVVVPAGEPPGKLTCKPIELGPNAARAAGDAMTLDFSTAADRVVGVDVEMEPAGA